MMTARAWFWRLATLALAMAIAVAGYVHFQHQKTSRGDSWLEDTLVLVGGIVCLVSLLLRRDRPRLFDLGVWLYVLGGTALFFALLEADRQWLLGTQLGVIGSARFLLWVGIIFIALGLGLEGLAWARDRRRARRKRP